MQRRGLVQFYLVNAVICLLLSLGGINCSGSSGSAPGDEGNTQIDDSDTGGAPPALPVACEDSTQPLAGNTYYLDPVNGNGSNDGSIDHPWGSLQEVIDNGMVETRAYANLPYNGTNAWQVKNAGAPIKAGDTLVLMDGFHGELNIRGAYNEHPIIIKAGPGMRPTLSRIFLSAAANWRIDDLVVSPSEALAFEANTIIRVESHNWHGPSSKIVVENCELFSVPNVSGWTMDDWNSKACSAISVSGDCMIIRNNVCRNVDFGITVGGNNALISGNTVENFAGDGLRGLGNDLVFEYNVVKNCYDVNGNHDDGFQSWSINDDPPRERVVLRGNTFVNYEDPNQPFRGTLQGIGCFDGPYIDWVIENNLVITDHWHGISLYGAQNSRIVNNTVVDSNDVSPGPPWIMVNPHKNGTPSNGCVIRNNIAATITATGDTVEDHNHLLSAEDNLFEDPNLMDYHLKLVADSPVIDQGSSDLAPDTDLDGVTRPRGIRPDIGCYEY